MKIKNENKSNLWDKLDSDIKGVITDLLTPMVAIAIAITILMVGIWFLFYASYAAEMATYERLYHNCIESGADANTCYIMASEAITIDKED